MAPTLQPKVLPQQIQAIFKQPTVSVKPVVNPVATQPVATPATPKPQTKDYKLLINDDEKSKFAQMIRD